MVDITQIISIGEVALAMLFGGIIGLERELSGKPAGLRTLMLVSGASALLMITGEYIFQQYQGSEHTALIRMDPVRIIQAIVTGIGFLGAGTIIRHHQADAVEGLTTAAAILVAGAVGICVGVDQYMLAAGISLLVLFVLSGVAFIERHLKIRNRIRR